MPNNLVIEAGMSTRCASGIPMRGLYLASCVLLLLALGSCASIASYGCAGCAQALQNPHGAQ
jgi:hypothetical protein